VVVTTEPPTPIGLYSIGIRGIDVPGLLALAAQHQVPFIHLRGGPNGYDISRRPRQTLVAWADQARETSPITIVTADLDLIDFLRHDHDAYVHATAELHRLAEATALVGAGSVRLIARRVPEATQWSELAVPDLGPTHGLTTLVELHDPSWFTPTVLSQLVEHRADAPVWALLVDSAQFHSGWHRHGDHVALAGLGLIASCTRVIHLSDDGAGLTGSGHGIMARSFADAAARWWKDVEVAFEWTGVDRSVEVCLARYRGAVEWWQRTTGERS
jgi:hypothetical protein